MSIIKLGSKTKVKDITVAVAFIAEEIDEEINRAENLHIYFHS